MKDTKLIGSIYTQYFNTAMHIKFQANSKCAFVLYYVVIADCAKLIVLDDPVPYSLKTSGAVVGLCPHALRSGGAIALPAPPSVPPLNDRTSTVS